MKNIFLILEILLLGIILLVSISSNKYLFAQPNGCCMQRNSTNENWYANGLNFWQCKQFNQHRDGDDVFAPSGLVWWDVRCQM